MFNIKKKYSQLDLEYDTVYEKRFNNYMIFLLGFLILLNLFTFFIGSRVVISGESMYPTLHNDENVFLNKIYYSVKNPEYNDIVVFKSHNTNNDGFVKRIIGLPGDTIEIKDGYIYRNGLLVEEFYLDSEYIKWFENSKQSNFTSDFSLKEGAYENSVKYFSDLKLSEFNKLESDNDLIYIPNDYYFVLGDNRPHSIDSREIGLISKESLEGKVYNFFK